MMEKCLKGWKSVREVTIPPIETQGFREKVVVRNKVDPIPYESDLQFEQDEETTVLIQQNLENEDLTVLLQPRAMQGFIYRKGTEEKTKINRDIFVIGKAKDCDYTIDNNMTISRHHVQIQKKMDGYYLKDLGSLNHTFVDNKQIEDEVLLKNGTTFCLSNEEFVFEMELE